MMTDSSLATPTIPLQCGRPKRRRRAARSPSSHSNASRGAAYRYKRPMRRGARAPSAASLARPGAYCGAAFCQGNLRAGGAHRPRLQHDRRPPPNYLAGRRICSLSPFHYQQQQQTDDARAGRSHFSPARQTPSHAKKCKNHTSSICLQTY